MFVSSACGLKLTVKHAASSLYYLGIFKVTDSWQSVQGADQCE